MTYTIRPYQASDRESVLQCIYTVQSEPGLGLEHITLENMLSHQPSLTNIEKYYQSTERGNLWVATVEGEQQIVGTVALEAMQADPRMLILRKMYVLPAHRGNKQRVSHNVNDSNASTSLSLAQQLYNTALQHAIKHSIHTIYLDTMGSAVAAQKFYQRQGFVIIEDDELPPEFRRPPPTMKVVNMKLKLSE